METCDNGLFITLGSQAQYRMSLHNHAHHLALLGIEMPSFLLYQKLVMILYKCRLSLAISLLLLTFV
jgi:hypothetical protein